MNKNAIQSYPKLIIANFLLALIYYSAALIGLSLAFEQANTSPVWPPAGIAIAATIYYGFRLLPGVFLGALFATLSTDLPVGASLIVALGNTAEPVVAALILKHYAGHNFLNRARGIVVFVAALMCAAYTSAITGVSTLIVTLDIPLTQASSLLVTWWLGDLTGGLVFAPFLLSMAQGVRSEEIKKNAQETFALLSITTLSMLIIFWGSAVFSQAQYPIAFFILPLIAWSAVRFQLITTMSFMLLISTVAVYATLLGLGPFVTPSANESLLLLQAFIGIYVVTALILSATETEKRLAKEALLQSQAILEQRVEERTLQLKIAYESLEEEADHLEKVSGALVGLLDATAVDQTQDFYNICARELASAYQTEYAFVGVFSNDSKTKVRTLSVWQGSQFVDNFEYDLIGTPCEDACNNASVLVPADAKLKYPDDQLLVDMDINSYYGAALVTDSNNTLGIVAVMDSRPINIPQWKEPILNIYAHRMALEVERISQNRELELAARVFSHSAQGMVITNNQGVILRINPAYADMAHMPANEIIGTPLASLITPAKGEGRSIQQLIEELQASGNWQGEILQTRMGDLPFPAWMSITATRDEHGKVSQYIGIIKDVTEQKNNEERIFHLAHYDTLTSLPNRLSFQNQLDSALTLATQKNRSVALLFIDLDRFKLINDTSGHDVGDILLTQVAQRLQSSVRPIDYLARLGGDEFTALLPEINSSQDAAKIAEKILASFLEPFSLICGDIITSASIGIALFPSDASDATSLLQHADIAMYRAKEKGRNNVQFFTPELNHKNAERLAIESDIRTALSSNEFSLKFQPQVDASLQNVTAVEALIRWEHPEKGLIPPGKFIPIAEECGLIFPLSEWVVEEACKQHQKWQQAGVNNLKIALNISAVEFKRDGLYELVRKNILKYQVPAEQLEIELTESIMMEHVDESIELLRALKQLGLSISIDDFGTGYSSLAYLKRFPIDKIKIDRSFIKDVSAKQDDLEIVSATIAMGHKLRLKVVAEGVETHQQLEFLQSHGCDELQGYFYSPPVSGDEIIQLMTEKIAI